MAEPIERAQGRLNTEGVYSTVVKPQKRTTETANTGPQQDAPKHTKTVVINYRPTDAEKRFLQILKGRLSEADYIIAENIVRRNVNSFHGMSAVGRVKFEEEAKSLNLDFPLLKKIF